MTKIKINAPKRSPICMITLSLHSENPKTNISPPLSSQKDTKYMRDGNNIKLILLRSAIWIVHKMITPNTKITNESFLIHLH